MNAKTIICANGMSIFKIKYSLKLKFSVLVHTAKQYANYVNYDIKQIPTTKESLILLSTKRYVVIEFCSCTCTCINMNHTFKTLIYPLIF